jgi:hypothetical protein
MNKKFVYQVGNNKKVILRCTANQISRYKRPVLQYGSTEHSPWEANSSLASQKISRILSCSLEPVTDPYPEPDESSPRPFTLIFVRVILM